MSAEHADAVASLDALGHRLRAECPWDREQDARSIVTHTVEEAYELADAAARDDDAKLLDELGDVLFQVVFLALLLEERDAGDLAEVAAHCEQKLIRRHPHVFGDVDVADAGEVLSNWDAIKRSEPNREQGLFGEVPDNLPGLLYARKLQRRAAAESAGGGGATVEQLGARVAALQAAETPEQRFEELGELLFATVAAARDLRLDPELAVRAAADRFRLELESEGEPSR